LSKTNKEILQEYLEKALITPATGGQLSAEQAEKFLTTVIDQSEILGKIQTYKMKASTRNIDTISIAGRQSRPVVEGSNPASTATVTIPRRTLVTKPMMLPVDLSYQTIEENIENGNLENVLLDLVTKAVANDVVDLLFNGDEGSADAFLQMNDGVVDIAIADALAHEVNTTGLADEKAIMKAMLQAMPNKYKGDKSSLAYFVSSTFEENYRMLLGERATSMGDAYLTENRRAYYQGIEVYPVPFAPTTKPILTQWKNLAVGIGREISREVERVPRKQQVEYTVTTKADFNYAISDLMVIGNPT
jgi:hypothetical protein